MNIFFLDHNPERAARDHCDKHVVKMILESAQLLSTAHHELGSGTPEMYRSTHKNHPCALWVRQSRAHYYWLLALFEALLDEYQARYSKVHASSRLLPILNTAPPALASTDWTDPPQAMPEHRRGDDAVEAYRRYYAAEKRRLVTWKTREPEWWQQACLVANTLTEKEKV